MKIIGHWGEGGTGRCEVRRSHWLLWQRIQAGFPAPNLQPTIGNPSSKGSQWSKGTRHTHVAVIQTVKIPKHTKIKHNNVKIVWKNTHLCSTDLKHSTPCTYTEKKCVYLYNSGVKQYIHRFKFGSFYFRKLSMCPEWLRPAERPGKHK